MKVLIVEDDFISRKLLQKVLSHFGECDVAVNGNEAVTAFKLSLKGNSEYDLICMDIMMPDMDGQQALKVIRSIEDERGTADVDRVKVIMTTALDDPKNVVESLHQGGASAYLSKPIDRSRLLNEIRSLGLLS